MLQRHVRCVRLSTPACSASQTRSRARMAALSSRSEDLVALVTAGRFQPARDVLCGEPGRQALGQAMRHWGQMQARTFEESAPKLCALPAYAQVHVLMFVIHAVVNGELGCKDSALTDMLSRLNHCSQPLAPLPAQLLNTLAEQCGCAANARPAAAGPKSPVQRRTAAACEAEGANPRAAGRPRSAAPCSTRSLGLYCVWRALSCQLSCH